VKHPAQTPEFKDFHFTFTLYNCQKMARTSKTGISMRTVKGWINDLDVTKTWIETVTEDKHRADGQPIVTKIRCKVCTEFAARLKNVRNFSTAFIHGTFCASLKRDNVNKYSMSVMHLHAIRMRERPTFSVDTCLKTTPIQLVCSMLTAKLKLNRVSEESIRSIAFHLIGVMNLRFRFTVVHFRVGVKISSNRVHVEYP